MTDQILSRTNKVINLNLMSVIINHVNKYVGNKDL